MGEALIKLDSPAYRTAINRCLYLEDTLQSQSLCTTGKTLKTDEQTPPWKSHLPFQREELLWSDNAQRSEAGSR